MNNRVFRPAERTTNFPFSLFFPLSLPSAGTSNLAREYDAFMQGIPLFSTVNLLINHEQPDDYRTADDTAAIDDSNGQTQKSANVEPDLDENLIDSDLNGGNSEPETDDETGEENNGADAQTGGSKKAQQKRKLLPNISKLDTCTIQVYPALNPEHEYFRLPVSYMNYLNVNYKQTQDGLIIYGIDTVHAYEQILREIIYFNRKPAYYLNRAFKLSCSELNGRFLSNDYIQTLTVIHPKVSTIGLSSENSDSEQQQQSGKPQLNSIKQHASKPTEIRLLGARLKQQAKQLATAQKKQFIEKHLNENRRLDEIKNGPLNEGEAIKHQAPVQSRIQTHQHRVELKAAKVKSADFVDPSLIEDSFARAPASKWKIHHF